MACTDCASQYTACFLSLHVRFFLGSISSRGMLCLPGGSFSTACFPLAVCFFCAWKGYVCLRGSSLDRSLILGSLLHSSHACTWTKCHVIDIGTGALVAGPRLGRFDRNGKPRRMPGHNSVFFLTGVLLLW